VAWRLVAQALAALQAAASTRPADFADPKFGPPVNSCLQAGPGFVRQLAVGSLTSPYCAGLAGTVLEQYYRRTTWRKVGVAKADLSLEQAGVAQDMSRQNTLWSPHSVSVAERRETLRLESDIYNPRSARSGPLEGRRGKLTAVAH
jgi:hypothetical protein